MKETSSDSNSIYIIYKVIIDKDNFYYEDLYSGDKLVRKVNLNAEMLETMMIRTTRMKPRR